MRVVIDTETTGFGHMGRPPRVDAIVQVGIAWRDPRGALMTWESLCNPGAWYLDEADPKALEVNGLTREQLEAAPDIRDVSLKLRLLLESFGTLKLHSYNMAFDRPFLSAGPWYVEEELWGECIMLKATQGNERWPKLKVAAERAGINLEGRRLHSAGEDAAIALEVMEWLEAPSRTLP